MTSDNLSCSLEWCTDFLHIDTRRSLFGIAFGGEGGDTGGVDRHWNVGSETVGSGVAPEE